MHRIDHPDAATSLPIPFTPGDPGYFTEGSPSAGDPPTHVTADWLNAVQEELVGAIIAAGLTLDKEENGQLIIAIRELGVPTGTVFEVAGTTVPNDSYLLADGSAVSRTTYARLFARIGTIFGAGDGSTTFNLPNLTPAANHVCVIKT